MPHRTVVLPAKLLPTPESTSPFNDRRAGEPMGEVDSGIQQIEPAGAALASDGTQNWGAGRGPFAGAEMIALEGPAA